MADDTARGAPKRNPAAHLEQFKWKPGQSANPAGRPKGSRVKLGEDFVAALLADFTEHGAGALATVRENEPAQYLKVIAQVIPKEVNVNVGQLEGLSDDDLARGIAVLESILAAQGMADGEAAESRH